MIRKGGKKSPLVEVSWEEAISYVAKRLTEIKEKFGPDAIMGTGSARGAGKTRPIISCRNSCARASAPTMSTTAPEYDMRLR